MARSTASVVLIFGTWGLSRYLDSFIRIFLRQKTGEELFTAWLRNVSWTEVGQEVVNLIGLGLALWAVFSLLMAWLGKRRVGPCLVDVSRAFYPGLLPVGLSGLAVLSLVLSPRFPYGLNLVLTLAYEGAFASILVWTLLGWSLIHTLWHPIPPLHPGLQLDQRARRFLSWGGKTALVVVVTMAFALLTPPEFWKDGQGQGHMLRYLRMTATLAGSGTLDIDQAEADGTRATLIGFLSRLPHLIQSSLQEAQSLLRAVVGAARDGKVYFGSVRANRANRAMFVHPEGGIYYIMNPGPAFLLLPAYLADRWVNAWLGMERQVTVILFWNFLSALLVLEMVRAARQIAGVSARGAVATSLALAFASPLLFYSYQVYPELPAAWILAYVFRNLLVHPAPGGRSVAIAGLAVGFLPWLHQKYTLTAALIGLLAIGKLARVGPARRLRLLRAGLLVLALTLSVFALLVYNHALTGSVLPDATYRAAGRATFDPRFTFRGILGLFLDVENGLLVFAPVYFLALVGLKSLFQKNRSALLYILAIAGSYLLIVGSVPYWSGPVSSVARFTLFVAPLAAPAVALALTRAASDGWMAGFAATVLAATMSLTASFVTDRVPTYFTRLMLNRTWYSDPYQYLPSFQSEGLFGSGPGHSCKLAAVLSVVVLTTVWLGRRVAAPRLVPLDEEKQFPRLASRGAAHVLCLTLAVGIALERLPGSETEKTGPVYRDSRPLDSAARAELAVLGKFGFEGSGVWVPGEGETRFILRSAAPIEKVELALRNGLVENRVQVGVGREKPLEMAMSPRQRQVLSVPLTGGLRFQGPEGKEWIYRLAVRSVRGFVPSRRRGSQDRRRLGCYVVLR